tara:strand:- start:51 stop:380 length:330 start_codon:yes stop_codon:yes gene_type:complete
MTDTTIRLNDDGTIYDYDGTIYDGNGMIRFCRNGHSYVPNLNDAREWLGLSKKDDAPWDMYTDRFIFVQDLLDLSLLDDPNHPGDEYVDSMVNLVETAFSRLLSKSYID